MDLNFENVALSGIKSRKVVVLKLLDFSLRKVLTQRIWAGRVMKKYGKRWKFSKGILEAIRKHHKRSKRILKQELHRIANIIVDIADRHNLAIVVEELNYLKENCKGSKDFNTRLTFFAYRKLLDFIEYKALERYFRSEGAS